ncbi:phage holin family protein [soil metagenome]
MSHPPQASATSTQNTDPGGGVHRAELPPGDEPTIGRLVADTSTHLSSLVRAEIALAKSELRFSAKAAGVGAALLGVAAFLLALAVVMVSIAAAYALALVLPTWLAFLIVFAVYALLAGVLALLGVKRLKKVSAPERTIETTKDTVTRLRNR